MYTDKLSTILGEPVLIEPLPLTLRYAPARLRNEALKAAVGAALCLAVLLALRPAAVIAWPVGMVGVLFPAYLVQQVRRRALIVELDAAGLSRKAGGATRRLEWSALDRFKLQFYPHRRRSLQGTLVLTLGGGFRVKVDSGLAHFPTLLLHAAAAARERALTVDSTTSANLAQLGL